MELFDLMVILLEAERSFHADLPLKLDLWFSVLLL